MSSRLNIVDFASHSVATSEKSSSFNFFGSDFYTDLLNEYDLKVDLEPSKKTPQTFEALCERPLLALQAKGNLQDVDLMVLAYDFPNCVSYNSTTAFLAHRFELDCHMFAVSDMGSASSLFAFHFVSQYLSSGKSKKALLISVDQPALPVLLPGVKSIAENLQNSATAMVIETGTALEVLKFDSSSRPSDSKLPLSDESGTCRFTQSLIQWWEQGENHFKHNNRSLDFEVDLEILRRTETEAQK